MKEITLGTLFRIAKQYTSDTKERLMAVSMACQDRGLWTMHRQLRQTVSMSFAWWPKTDSGKAAYHAIVVYIIKMENEEEAAQWPDWPRP